MNKTVAEKQQRQKTTQHHHTLTQRRQKSFQGWRYYKDEETPGDIDHSGSINFEDIPPDMIQDLRELCLI